MISFAGVALRAITDPDVKAYVARWTDAHAADIWERRYDTLANLHFPPPPAPQRRPLRPGVLVWPNGGHRQAEFCEFVTREQADAILAALAAADTPTATLVISDGTNSITAVNMYLMGFRPVFQKGENELYLMILTDVRQIWRRDNGDLATGGSWADSIKEATGLSITWDIATIPAAYKSPDGFHWLALLPNGPTSGGVGAEAMARQCGMRITLRLADGVPTVNNYTTAKALDDSQWAAYSDRVLLGGRWTINDIQRFVPNTLTLISYRAAAINPDMTSDGAATVGLASLALADFEGYPGGAGIGYIVHDCLDDISSGDFTAYVTQAATDWYLWHLALTDATFSGIVPWVPTGFEDRIEWVHDWDADAIYTRVIPAPHSDHNLMGGWPYSPLPWMTSTGGSPQLTQGGQVAVGGGNQWYLQPQPLPDVMDRTYYLRLTVLSTGVYSVSWETLP